MKRIFDIRLEFEDLSDQYSVESVAEEIEEKLAVLLNACDGKITRCIEEPPTVLKHG